jgi:hypothetical protein
MLKSELDQAQREYDADCRKLYIAVAKGAAKAGLSESGIVMRASYAVRDFQRLFERPRQEG